MVDLNSLRGILRPLADLNRIEHTFYVEGVSFTVRPLTPNEEIEVRQVISDGTEDTADTFAAMAMIHQFRIETLARAIVAVGGEDLRGVEYILTGENSPSGVPTKISRVDALRELIKDWPSAISQFAYIQYGIAHKQLNDKVKAYIEQDPSDLDAEIERTKAYLSELEGERSTRAVGDPRLTEEVVEAFIYHGMPQQHTERAPEPTPEQERPPHVEPAPQGRRSVLPPSSPPPTPPPPMTSFNHPDLDEDAILALRGSPQPDGDINGVPAYRMPAVEIHPERSTKPQIKPPEPHGTHNPHFRPNRR
jgi:hypothetical protein